MDVEVGFEGEGWWVYRDGKDGRAWAGENDVVICGMYIHTCDSHRVGKFESAYTRSSKRGGGDGHSCMNPVILRASSSRSFFSAVSDISTPLLFGPT